VSGVQQALARIAWEAQSIDVSGVTRGHVDALAYHGALGVTAPVELGGQAASAADAREVTELLSGASGAVWFVTTQHRTPLESALASAPSASYSRWAAPLSSGKALGAVAFAHLRRPGEPSVRATRTASGWQVTGTLDWVTSWGLADALLLMAETDDRRVVQALVPAREREGFVVTGPLALAAMGGTSTVGAWLDGMRIEDDEVAAIVDKQEWLARDAERTANANPAVFGLMRAVIADLNRLGLERSQPAAVDAARRFAEQVLETRASAYRLLDEVSAADGLDERIGLRARSLVLLQRITAARIAAQGGSAMLMLSPAQRWAREGLFHLVQAQTQPLREALLAEWSKQS
jgi:alkylation response protein AidB-like acyl-CoA dehydrogenase